MSADRPDTSAASSRGILVGVAGFRVMDCDTGRDLGTYKTREEAELVQRCTCDLTRPYWHSFHREGCPLAR